MVRFLLLALLVLAAPLAAAQTEQRVDPNDSRLFVSPTARTMPQGQGRFSDYMVFFPSLAYGFNDWLDASASVSIIPGSSVQTLTANLKARVHSSENLDVAVGNLLATLIGDVDGNGLAGSVYGLATFGSTRRALTVGAYVAYAAADFESTTCSGDVCETESYFELGVSDDAVFMVGGEWQLSNSVKLITENYLGVGDGRAGGVVSGGIRFFGERLAADFALFQPISSSDDLDGFPAVPYVGFAYNF
jgi:hypothetical protein